MNDNEMLLYEVSCFSNVKNSLADSITIYVIESSPLIARKKAMDYLKSTGWWHPTSGVSEPIILATADTTKVTSHIKFIIL